jgi:hypothetical protein
VVVVLVTVANFDVKGADNAVPAELVTPLTVTVKVLFCGSAAAGVKVATLVPALYATVPATAWGSVTWMLALLTVVAFAAEEKVI